MANLSPPVEPLVLHQPCPEDPDDRIPLMQDWTCDQYDEFYRVETSYIICGYVFKGTQIAVFSTLIVTLIYRACKGRGQVGKLTLFLAVLCLLNGVFSIIRVDSIFPVFDNQENYAMFCVFYCLESICFFGTIWFFSIKYYETAQDLENILVKEEKEQTSQLRKRNWLVLRWVVFAAIIVTHSLESFAWADRSIEKAIVAQILIGFGYFADVTLIISVTVLMLLALRKIISVVSRTQAQQNLNHCFIIVQILALLVWSGTWIGEGFYFMVHYTDYNAYEPVRNVIIIDTIAFGVTLFLFMIVALVIYQSSIALVSLNDSRTQSNIAYLRNQIKEQKAIETLASSTDQKGTQSPHFQGMLSSTEHKLYSTNDKDKHTEDEDGSLLDQELLVKAENPNSQPQSSELDGPSKAGHRHESSNDPEIHNRTIEEIAGKQFRDSLDVENQLGKDDWHLCEGLLTIFLKGSTRQTLTYNKALIGRDNRDGTVRSSLNIGNNKVVLDLGSCKETISIEPPSQSNYMQSRTNSFRPLVAGSRSSDPKLASCSVSARISPRNNPDS